MLRLILDAGYEDYLKETYDNYERRLGDLQELAQFAFQFGSVEEFLTQLALLTNVEAEEDPKDGHRAHPPVHDSSGKGARVRRRVRHHAVRRPVSLGAFRRERRGQEEERRLFYVSITRAKNELYLSYPLVRGGFGASGVDTYQSPSRFLAEIPRELLNPWNLR